jgi:hypothetical protein
MKLGFNRNTAHAVAYGPSHYGGLGLRNWVVEQGITQTILLIRHLRGSTDQGRLLLILLSWWHLYTGTSYQLLQDPHPLLPLGDHHIFSSLRSYFKEVNGSFYVTALDSMLPSPNRAGDICLMEAIAALPAISASDVQRFNRSRLFFGLGYLSEITSADGLSLARDAWECTRSRHSPLLWPYQPNPGPRCFRVWRRLLARAFLRGPSQWTGATLKYLSLCSALGDWLPGYSWLHSRWSSFFSSSMDSAYRRLPAGSYAVHASIPVRKRPVKPVRAFSLHPSHTPPCLPPDSVPINLDSELKLLSASTRSYRLRLPDPPLPPPVSWYNCVSRLPIWACNLLSDVTFSVPIEQCLSILQTPSSILLASDGGACPYRASFGSLLATDGHILVTAGGHAFGDDPRSFRAEAYGMLAALLLLQHLHTYFQIPMVVSSLSHYTDSESLIKRLEKSRTL